MEKQLFIQRIEAFKRGTDWINRHYDELKVKYPDEWIASLGEGVIEHNRNLRELMKQLKKTHPRDVDQVAVEFVSPKKVELILYNRALLGCVSYWR